MPEPQLLNSVYITGGARSARASLGPSLGAVSLLHVIWSSLRRTCIGGSEQRSSCAPPSEVELRCSASAESAVGLSMQNFSAKLRNQVFIRFDSCK